MLNKLNVVNICSVGIKHTLLSFKTLNKNILRTLGWADKFLNKNCLHKFNRFLSFVLIYSLNMAYERC